MAGTGPHHDRHRMSTHPPPLPFHLLEVTVVSAQDLHPATRAMRSYAVTWVQPDHKLRTRLDAAGHTEPSWNHKFLFRVSSSFLHSDTSQVYFELYTARHAPLADALLGTARLVLSALRPTPAIRFVAIQVRRPASLRPQGILNIGVALLDSYARSAPLLYADLPPSAAAVALRRGEDDEDQEKWRSLGRSKSKAAMERKLVRWREELPQSREHEKPRERRERRLDAGYEKKETREKWERMLDGGYDRKEKGKQVREGGSVNKLMRRASLGGLACFGGGGRWVQEGGARS